MGLLPISDCREVDAPPQGCDFLFETANELLEAALAGLTPYIPIPEDGCPEDFSAMVTHGPPVAELYDSLTVHLVNFGHTSESRARWGRMSGNPKGVAPLFQALYEFQLWENGYPVVHKNEIGEVLYVPTSEQIHAVNKNTYAHAAAAHQALNSAIVKAELELPRIDKLTQGDLLPLGPSGGAAGWRWQVTCEVGEAHR